MFSISVQTNIAAVSQQLDANVRQQIPFATAKALTATAKLAQAAQIKEMKDVFDRPTPWTLGGTYVKPATKTDLTATVKLKDELATSSGVPAAKYLQAEIAGGERRLKRFEKLLRGVGVLPEGMFAVPGSAAQIDAYGNISRNQLIQLISYFRAFPELGYKSNATAATRARIARGTKRKQGVVYFVGRPANGKLPLGVWARYGFGHGSAIKPILIFVDSASYRERYNFAYVTELTVRREFDGQFNKALIEALAAARG